MFWLWGGTNRNVRRSSGYQAHKSNEMADYIFDFTLTGKKFSMEKKVQQVSSTNP
jgi:hypothetical protein